MNRFMRAVVNTSRSLQTVLNSQANAGNDSPLSTQTIREREAISGQFALGLTKILFITFTSLEPNNTNLN